MFNNSSKRDDSLPPLMDVSLFRRYINNELVRTPRDNSISLCHSWGLMWRNTENSRNTFTGFFEFIIVTWPEYSGSIVYPIGNGSMMWHSCRHRFYDGEYGESRLRLVDYIYDSLSRYEYLCEKYPRFMWPFIRYTFKWWNKAAIAKNGLRERCIKNNFRPGLMV